VEALRFERDPELIEQAMRRVKRVLQGYFAPQVRGIEQLPQDGPFMIVSTHSGGLFMPDMWALGAALVDALGVEREIYGLMFDLAFAIPGAGPFLRKLGAIPASTANAERALDRGAAVVVYPGGDLEAYRPWSRRNQVDLQGHAGFIKIALRRGVPVFPVVSHGSHQSTIVVARGDRLARAMGLHRVRVNVFPLVLAAPFGLTTVLVPHVPLPTKVVVEVLEPVDWSHLGPRAASDPVALARCYDEVTARMQQAVDRLVREMPHPLLSRFGLR
jgi:1-acyl-sn-glycerol-3-phosphate acyltransferase